MMPSFSSADLDGSAFPDQAVLSVSSLNQAVARTLERQFPLVWISGEIGTMTVAASGHWYFTLKDDQAQVRAVMFRQRAQYADFTPRIGDRIEVRALASLYAPRGEFQLSVEAIRRAGRGNLHEAFLQLKDRLSRQGLFSADRKQALPLFARTVGIVSSLQAAALRDVLATLARRAPHVQIIIYPTPVQGAAATAQIAAAIRQAGLRDECDVLLICRGGGSLEDLWCFNEEAVAVAISECAIPTISGVGHETDMTIADMVADVRAPTPTAAAELCCTSRADWLGWLEGAAHQLQRRMARQLRETAQTLDHHSRRLTNPAGLLQGYRRDLNHVRERCRHLSLNLVQQTRSRLEQARFRLERRRPDIALQRMQLNALQRRLQQAVQRPLDLQQRHLSGLQGQLQVLDPARTVARGYAIVRQENGQIVQHPAQLQDGAGLSLQLAQGNVGLTIANVRSLPAPAGETVAKKK